MAESNYQRLTGRTWAARHHHSWLAMAPPPAASTLVAETYRRWYLVEIQAIIARRSRKRMAWNLVWGILGGAAIGMTAGFLGLAAATGAEREMQVVLRVFAVVSGVIGVAAGLLMLINTALGATCDVFIQTPHGLDPVGAPTRQRAFNRFLAQLRPQIEVAQRAIRSERAPAESATPAEATTG